MICPQEKALIDACLDPAHAQQDAPPLVYADFLQERGREPQAQLVRQLIAAGDLTVSNRHQVRSLGGYELLAGPLSRIESWGRVPCPECDGTQHDLAPTDRLCSRCRSTGDIGGLTWFRNSDTVHRLQSTSAGCCACHADNQSCFCLSDSAKLQFRRGILVGIHNLKWLNLLIPATADMTRSPPDGWHVLIFTARWTGVTEWLDRLRVHHPHVTELIPRGVIHSVEYGRGDDRWRIYRRDVPHAVAGYLRIPGQATVNYVEYPSLKVARSELTKAIWQLIHDTAPEPNHVHA